MVRLLGVLSILLALLVGAYDAQAQVLLAPCSVPQLADPDEAFKRYNRKEVVGVSEVIVEGVVESYSAAKSDPYLPRSVVMRVDKVWKGDVTPHVILMVQMEWYGPDFPTWEDLIPNCSNPVQIGERVRIAAELLGKNDDSTFRDPALDASTDVLGYRLRWNIINVPLHDPEFNRLLAAYQAEAEALRAKTEALERAAATGNLQAKLAFVEHLYKSGERDRAHEIAGALRRGGVKLSLADPLLLDPEQSDLKRIHNACYSDHGNFDDAVFDGADLSECAFRYSSFRGASFRGTDLTGSYFQDSDLTGAKYDCAAKLPDDLDPVAAGMVNVDGTCPLQVPQ
jgi:hypothetical protein